METLLNELISRFSCGDIYGLFFSQGKVKELLIIAGWLEYERLSGGVGRVQEIEKDIVKENG